MPPPKGAFPTWQPGESGSKLYTPGAYRTDGGLPAGLLEAVSWTESRNNPRAVSPAGAQGQFQFMPGTWAQYGHGSPFDPAQARQAAARYFRVLLGQFGGDTAEAAAAYNWGPGNVSRDIAQHGSDWLRYAPAETQNYVAQIARLMRKQMQQMQTAAKPSIAVHNNTGGSAVISTSMLAAT